MTTNQAAQKAADLYIDRSMSGKQIARELARSGYFSWRTGKPLSSSGALALAKKYMSGTPIRDTAPRKHAKKIAMRNRWKANKQVWRDSKKELPEARASVQLLALPNPPHAIDAIAQEQQARAVMKRAIETMVLKMFGAKVIVLLPTDVSFRVEG